MNALYRLSNEVSIVPAALMPVTEHAGTVTAVRGSVVDVRFPSHVPPLRRRLLAGEQAAHCWGSAGLWFTLRLTVSMAGFYLIFSPDRSLPRLSVALLTFIAARVLLIRRLRPAPATSWHTP